MRTLMFNEKNRLEWRDTPEPEVREPGDVLVRPFAVARCDLDTFFLLNNGPRALAIGHKKNRLSPDVETILHGKFFKGPFPYGHEFIGEITAVGETVRDFKKGDKVIVPVQITCGTCASCTRGLTGLCQSTEPLSWFGFGESTGNHGGAISEAVRVPFADHMLVPFPEGGDALALASASDNLPDAWRTVGPPLRANPGAPVLIVGGGAASIGLYAAAIAVALGAERVDYLDRDPERLEVAKRVGANPLEGDFSFDGSYPVTVDASTDAAGINCAVKATAPGGICTSVGIYYQAGVELDLFRMYWRGITLRTGPANARADIPEILKLVGEGGLKPELITTRLAQWDDAIPALMEPTVKVVVHRPPLA